MIDELDLLLEQVRDPEPFDEGFVQLVMTDVRADEQRRLGRRSLRRPMIMGIAAAVLVTGGAVAAVVGSNPEQRRPEAAAPVARPSVVVKSDAPTASRPAASSKGVIAGPKAKVDDVVKSGRGYLTDHTSYIVDKTTGLSLETESYTNAFIADEAQQVTLVLENTGRHPITIRSPKGCGLQVSAVRSGTEPIEADLGTAYACAGSTADPRTPAMDETWVLKAGGSRTLHAMLTLPTSGTWRIVGTCRCAYTQMRPTPVPKSDPLGSLTQRALPAPLLPVEADGYNLATPPIGVRAK
jgi:hypothetical protein